MKISIGKYPIRLICNIHTNHMNKKYGSTWADSQDYEDSVLEAIEDGVQRVYDGFNWIWFDRRTQKVKIRIDKEDTWSMDHTLAPIILPMLKQLRATKHGAPMVNMKDVPKELRATKKQMDKYGKGGEIDPKHFERWDWIMDEMIWAFEQKCRDDWMEDYDYNKWDSEGVKAHNERMSNGFRLFGTYFENLWD